jgi:Txe/YoeB family toxin of Txe-Axe toxin-antitoxin module
MIVVSTREFKQNQKNYLDKIDADIQVFIQRGEGQTLQDFTCKGRRRFWSRRITDVHRLVYDIDDEKMIVSVVSA